MDAAIVLTLIAGVYFVYEYVRVNKRMPQRSLKLISVTQAQTKRHDETVRQIELLINSQQFQDYQENKSKFIESDFEKENFLENETDIMREIKEKETLFFDD